MTQPAKKSVPHFTLRLLLDTDKADEDAIEKRFHALSHIHNVAVRHVRDQIQRLENHPGYQKALAFLKTFPKEKERTEDEQYLYEKLWKYVKDLRADYGLTAYGLQSWILPCSRQYAHLLSSTQVQKEMSNVARAISAYFGKKGKQIHFRKFSDFETISGKNPANGVVFDKDGFGISWLGLNICCRMPRQQKSREYIEKALQNDIAYCTIKRMMFNNGWHYYVIITFKGRAPSKGHKAGKGTAGYDPGVSSAAVVSDSMILLEELAPDCHRYNEKIEKLQQSQSISRGLSNPENFNEDGTIKKGKKTWKNSKSYLRRQNRIKALYRQKSAYTHDSHSERANRIVADSRNINCEKMNFPALARKAKDTRRQETPSVVKDRHGNERKVFKYVRRKRFGKSIQERSPALMVSILKGKVEAAGGIWNEISPQKFKASQYNHVTGDYVKAALDERTKDIGGHRVQRDLYSAWLMKNAEEGLERADQKKCENDFERFLMMHDAAIKAMKENGISMKQCFGF